MVAEPVRSMCLGGDKFGESREAVHSELLTHLVAADDVLGGGGPREARLQDRDDEKVGEIDKKEEDSEKVGDINQVPTTKSSLKPKTKTKRREHLKGTGRGSVSLVKEA